MASCSQELPHLRPPCPPVLPCPSLPPPTRLPRRPAGTAARIAKLVEVGALSLAACDLVMYDVRPDVKGYTLLNHPNLRDDCFTLFREHVHARLVAGSTKLALY